jgi:hypothetical protein
VVKVSGLAAAAGDAGTTEMAVPSNALVSNRVNARRMATSKLQIV